MTIEHTDNDDDDNDYDYDDNNLQYVHCTYYTLYNVNDEDWEPRFNDTLLINFCKSLQNLGEESVGELLMGEYQSTNILYIS